MARKPSTALKPKVASDPIEEARERYEAAQRELDASWAENNAMFSSRSSDGLKKGISQAEFKESLTRIDRAQKATFGAFDMWQYAVAHKDDKVLAVEEDVRSVVIASLDDKLDEIQFSLNGGLLASKVAQAIRQDVSEEDLDVPLCEDHG